MPIHQSQLHPSTKYFTQLLHPSQFFPTSIGFYYLLPKSITKTIDHHMCQISPFNWLQTQSSQFIVGTLSSISMISCLHPSTKHLTQLLDPSQFFPTSIGFYCLLPKFSHSCLPISIITIAKFLLSCQSISVVTTQSSQFIVGTHLFPCYLSVTCTPNQISFTKPNIFHPSQPAPINQVLHSIPTSIGFWYYLLPKSTYQIHTIVFQLAPDAIKAITAIMPLGISFTLGPWNPFNQQPWNNCHMMKSIQLFTY